MEEKDIIVSPLETFMSPGDIVTNFHELRESLSSQLEPFKKYSVADETVVPEAKKTIASLRKIRKMIDEKRLETKKEYLVPYNEFEGEVKTLLSLIDEPIKKIDSAIKSYEQLWRDERLEEVQSFFDEHNSHNFLELNHILEKKWLNQSTSTKKWQDEVLQTLAKIDNDIEEIQETYSNDGDRTQVLLDYLNHNLSLDVAKSALESRKREISSVMGDETVTITKARYDELIEIEELYYNLLGDE